MAKAVKMIEEINIAVAATALLVRLSEITRVVELPDGVIAALRFAGIHATKMIMEDKGSKTWINTGLVKDCTRSAIIDVVSDVIRFALRLGAAANKYFEMTNKPTIDFIKQATIIDQQEKARAQITPY